MSSPFRRGVWEPLSRGDNEVDTIERTVFEHQIKYIGQVS